MNEHKLGMFRSMSTIPEGFYKTDGTYIYIVGPIVVCGKEYGVDEQSGVRVWSVNTGLVRKEPALVRGRIGRWVMVVDE